MEKVLIYGFGWSGQSAFRFFTHMGMDCYVVDDNIEKSAILAVGGKFIEFEDIDKIDFDIVFVAIFNKKLAITLRDKLVKAGLDISIIKNFAEEHYTKNMKYLLNDFFLNKKDFVANLIKDDFYIKSFHLKLKKLIKRHYRNRNNDVISYQRELSNIMPNQSVFSKIFETSMNRFSDDYIHYPGFNVLYSKYTKDDKNFYFIQDIDFEMLEKREKNKKLIVCFGNSALRVEYLPIDHTITAHLSNILNNEDFIVINCGIGGYTLYEQIMLYNAVIYPLKPDIVVSFFGGVDLIYGFMGCERMLKRHKMIYAKPWEANYKDLMNSNFPLLVEGSNVDIEQINIDITDVGIAIKTRLMQFKDIVCGGGGDILCIYPTLIAV